MFDPGSYEAPWERFSIIVEVGGVDLCQELSKHEVQLGRLTVDFDDEWLVDPEGDGTVRAAFYNKTGYLARKWDSRLQPLSKELGDEEIEICRLILRCAGNPHGWNEEAQRMLDEVRGLIGKG